MEPDVPQLAEVTESGWTNGYMMKKWLETVFDPYTRDVPPGKQRLLIMDGHDTHVQVDFLDSCWSRGIDCLILPSNMTSIFQPLNVAFFNQLKSAYHSKVHSHLLFSKSTSLSKGLLWKWHQQAWKETAVSRNKRPAWKKSGLWPLDRSILGLEHSTPPPILAIHDPQTPSTIRIGRRNLRAVRRGDLNAERALLKSHKALEIMQAENLMQKHEISGLHEAAELDKAARARLGKAKYPQGQFFDPSYQMDHAEELSKRRAREKATRAARKGKSRAVDPPQVSDLVSMQAGPSRSLVVNDSLMIA